MRPYEVHLDGVRAWPPDDGRPPCTIHTREGERRARLVFGSCRVGDPEHPPYTLPPSEHELGFDWLHAGVKSDDLTMTRLPAATSSATASQ